MKRHIILIIAVFISFISCKQANNNRDSGSLTNTEKVVDTLSNDTKCKVEVKKDVEILLDSVFDVKKDSLYINYKVINNTTKNLLFFHLGCLGVELNEAYMDNDYPGSTIFIMNYNNELPRLYKANTRRTKDNPSCYPYAYILLHAGESKSFYGEICIGNYHLLGSSFKLKLKYSSPYNKDFINRFKRMQSKNSKLKDYERFEGVIESNQCPFTL